VTVVFLRVLVSGVTKLTATLLYVVLWSGSAFYRSIRMQGGVLASAFEKAIG
jgi:hypothetical protein